MPPLEQLEAIDFNQEREDAFQRAMHRTLADSEDHLRRIHWWVRLFGIVWIVIPAVMGIFAAVFFFAAFVVSSSGR